MFRRLIQNNAQQALRLSGAALAITPSTPDRSVHCMWSPNMMTAGNDQQVGPISVRELSQRAHEAQGLFVMGLSGSSFSGILVVWLRCFY